MSMKTLHHGGTSYSKKPESVWWEGEWARAPTLKHVCVTMCANALIWDHSRPLGQNTLAHNHQQQHTLVYYHQAHTLLVQTQMCAYRPI